MIVRENHQRFYDWINERIGTNYTPEMCQVISIVSDHSAEIKAVLVFYDWVQSERRLSVSFATDNKKNWANVAYAEAWLEYVFNVLNVNRLQFYSADPEAQTLGKQLGFEFEANLQDWFGPDKSTGIYVLLRSRLTKTKLMESTMFILNDAGGV
jgi:hypothetical protein